MRTMKMILLGLVVTIGLVTTGCGGDDSDDGGAGGAGATGGAGGAGGAGAEGGAGGAGAEGGAGGAGAAGGAGGAGGSAAVTTEQVQTLTNLRCSPCHVSADGSAAGNIDPPLNDIGGLVGTASRGGRPFVTAGSRDDSEIFVRVAAPAGQMPPAGPLSDEEIETYGAWIDGL